MADNSYMIIRCVNPECGQMIKLIRPEVSGIYPVTCPHCNLKKNFKLKGVDAFNPGASAAETAPVADNSAKEPILLRQDFRPEETYKIECPHCGATDIELKSPAPGQVTFMCPKCKGKLVALIRKPTRVVTYGGDSVQSVNGKLVVLRKGWLSSNKEYHLKPGRYTVGRHDEQAMSDISIKNDSSMSRRSVRIDVEPTSRGLSFRLTVLKSTNPVLHNNVPLGEGESVLLNFGDGIILGRTRLRFDKDV